MPMWNKFPDLTPPDNPDSENFGTDYDVKYRLPNGKIEITTTEWLCSNEWNIIYPVTAWKGHKQILPFVHRNSSHLQN